MRRMIWIVPMALTVAFGAVSVNSTPAMAQKAGEVRTRITLAGAWIKGTLSQGTAEFRSGSGFRSLRVQAEKVNLADGTALTVAVNGAAVGSIKLALMRGEMEVSMKNGAAVPAVKAGDTLTVVGPTGLVVLIGKF